MRAYDNYVKDGIDPVQRREGTTSQCKGVSWDKSRLKWAAQCKGKHLGHHATEEAAAQAYDDYVKDGVDPVQRREGTSSQFKGVSWHKRRGKWLAVCKGKSLGCHATEEAAAQAYNAEAERIGLVDLKFIPPGGDADDGDSTAAPAARLLLTMFASAGSKRAAPAAPARAPLSKQMRLDASAGAAAGGGGGRLVVAAQGQH